MATAAVALAMGIGPAAAVDVGVTSAVNSGAFGTPPASTQRTLFIGTELVFEEEIETDAQGQAQILFRDRSSLTVSPNARLVIDRFVYDPNEGTGELTVSFSQGLMRFVGGALSKQDDQVTVQTPSATIGIRGGGTLIDVDPATQETVVTFMLGQWADIRLPDGTQRRLTIPGTQQRIPPGGGGADLPPVGRAGSTAIGASLERLDGQAGRSAGATDVPTDDRVGTTDLVVLGSDLGPGGDPTVDGGLVDGEAATAETEDAPGLVPDTTNEVVEGVQDDATPTPQDEPTPINGRLIASAFQYETTSGGVVPTSTPPGLSGLLGGEQDDIGGPITAALFGPDRVTITDADGNTGALPLPSEAFTFTAFETGLGDFGPVSGGTGVLADGALRYVYGRPDAAPDQAFFFFYGSPTPNSGLIPTERQVRRYTVHSDPVQGGDLIPFSPPQLGFGRTGAAVSDFYLLEPVSGFIGVESVETPGGTGPFTPFLQASLQIDGQGAEQRSLLIAAIGDMDRDVNDAYLNIAQSFRASFRPSAWQSIYPMRLGGTETVPADIASFFGPDLDAFIIGQPFGLVREDGTSDPIWFVNRYIEGINLGGGAVSTASGPDYFGFLNPVELTSTVPDVSGAEAPDRISAVLNGFAAGFVEVRRPGQPIETVTAMTPWASPEDLAVTFNAPQNAMSVAMTLDAGDYLATVYFGDGLGSETDSFIDGDAYGAAPSAFLPGVIYDFGSETATQFDVSEGAFIPHSLAPDDDWLPDGVTLCTCAYIEWGWWSVADFGTPLPDGTDPDTAVHLATWAAGDLVSGIDVPASGTAVYSGHAIGTVLNNDHTYVAAGNYRHVWDFAASESVFEITDFDNRMIAGNLTPDGSDTAIYVEGLVPDSLDWQVNAHLVSTPSDPVGGVIGQFRFEGFLLGGGTPYSAVGTLAAERIVADLL